MGKMSHQPVTQQNNEGSGQKYLQWLMIHDAQLLPADDVKTLLSKRFVFKSSSPSSGYIETAPTDYHGAL